MLKAKLMNIFKSKFGGDYTKENGKIYWIKDTVKELVTSGFLNHYIRKNVSPVEIKVSTKIKEENKPTKKKAKKDAAPQTNPEVSQGS